MQIHEILRKLKSCGLPSQTDDQPMLCQSVGKNTKASNLYTVYSILAVSLEEFYVSYSAARFPAVLVSGDPD